MDDEYILTSKDKETVKDFMQELAQWLFYKIDGFSGAHNFCANLMCEVMLRNIYQNYIIDYVEPDSHKEYLSMFDNSFKQLKAARETLKDHKDTHKGKKLEERYRNSFKEHTENLEGDYG